MTTREKLIISNLKLMRQDLVDGKNMCAEEAGASATNSVCAKYEDDERLQEKYARDMYTEIGRGEGYQMAIQRLDSFLEELEG